MIDSNLDRSLFIIAFLIMFMAIIVIGGKVFIKNNDENSIEKPKEVIENKEIIYSKELEKVINQLKD